MSHAVRKIVSFSLAVLCLSSSFACGLSLPELSAKSYILMDADSGRVLFGHNETQEMSIASTTKIMTALVALDCRSLSDVATVKRAHLKEGSSMYLAKGEKLSLEALLYGLLLPSGNDAAECIAEYCGGTRAQFVAQMNRKAAELGMTHTHFANPSGLDEEGHHSCALDMARLAAAAMQNPVFARIVSTSQALVGSRSMENHNKLLSRLDGCIGLKTGYTGDAGRTLVSCVQRGGLRLIAVTLYDGNDWEDHAALYECGFSRYRLENAVQIGQTCASLRVSGGERETVGVIAADTFSYPLLEGEALHTELSLPDKVSAPLQKGQKLGEMVISLNGQELSRVELRCGEEIGVVQAKKGGFAEWFCHILSQ